ncbi:MAG: hypothetical protein ACOZE5_15310 [Verrucomicrobiota bacterium]
MPVRPLFLLISLLLAPALAASDLTLVRIYTGWRDAASFKRISEYFNGRENTGGEAVLRTHPDQRGGYYFLVRIANPGAPRAVTARLQVITDAGAKPRAFTFTPELRTGDTVFHLGLTGPDWPDAKADPVAWKLDLTGPDGTVLASEKSYLWEKPAAK